MYIKTKFEKSEPDGQHDLFVYGNNEEYLLFLQRFFLDASRHSGCKIVFYGPEATCSILEEILEFWKLTEKKSAVAASIFRMETFFGPDKRFKRKRFIKSMSDALEHEKAKCLYSCVDMNIPLALIRSEKEIFSFFKVLNRVYSRYEVTGFCTVYYGSGGEEYQRRNLIRQFRKVYFPERVYGDADICRRWQNQIRGAERGISELLAGNRPCSEKLLSGMFNSHAEMVTGPDLQELQDLPEIQNDSSETRIFNDALWITDERGRITYVSPSIKTISGKENNSYIGKYFLDAVTPENMQVMREIYRTGIRHSRKNSTNPIMCRGTFIVGKNRRISLICSLLPIKTDRELIGFVGSVRSEGPTGMNDGMDCRLPEELNDRDLRILEYLLDGYSIREIGDRIALAEVTIKKNLTRIYRIFNVENRTALLIQMYRIKNF